MGSTDLEVRRAYRDDQGLLVRQALYRWQRPPLDLPGAILAELKDIDGLVIDVGCGNGLYLAKLQREWPRLRPVGVDSSPGMLARARTVSPASPVVCADAAALPFPDGVATAALAIHLLYLIEDPRAVIRELCRIVSDHGTVIVATSAADDKVELEPLLSAAFCPALTPTGVVALDVHRRFQLGSAELAMREEFDEVAVRGLRSAIVVQAADPLLRYVDSLRWLYEPALPSDVAWETVMAKLGLIVSDALAARGAIRVSTHTGFVVGRRHGIRSLCVRRPVGEKLGGAFVDAAVGTSPT
jgi:SAM-dependent methyltransferase